jgi:hypothetical protein
MNMPEEKNPNSAPLDQWPDFIPLRREDMTVEAVQAIFPEAARRRLWMQIAKLRQQADPPKGAASAPTAPE